ncbi:MAG TPA: Hsp20/alpha crystallin family protein [Tepidisphaeraceae bacterium]|jgi:HSP20 family protein
MTVDLAIDPPFGSVGRAFRRAGEPHKGYYGFAPADTWTPNVNLYESEVCYLVCVDLAGIEKSEIDVVVHEQRLRLTGRREVPIRDAPDECRPRVRIHLMEIDHGAFSREVELPADVNKEQITATQKNGLLWIELPKTEG